MPEWDEFGKTKYKWTENHKNEWNYMHRHRGEMGDKERAEIMREMQKAAGVSVDDFHEHTQRKVRHWMDGVNFNADMQHAADRRVSRQRFDANRPETVYGQ